MVLVKLILAIHGAPFQLFTSVHEDTIVEIRDYIFLQKVSHFDFQDSELNQEDQTMFSIEFQCLVFIMGFIVLHMRKLNKINQKI